MFCGCFRLVFAAEGFLIFDDDDDDGCGALEYDDDDLKGSGRFRGTGSRGLVV